VSFKKISARPPDTSGDTANPLSVIIDGPQYLAVSEKSFDNTVIGRQRRTYIPSKAYIKLLARCSNRDPARGFASGEIAGDMPFVMLPTQKARGRAERISVARPRVEIWIKIKFSIFVII